jgi:two-component system nitrate/nitrite response regulator NarL
MSAMSLHLLLSPSGRAPARWREAFPEGAAWTPAAAELAALPADAVLWACAPAEELAALVARLGSQRPDLPVAALDLQPSQATAETVFAAGARAYCHALATAPMLLQVAVVVSHGGLWVGPELMSRMVAATRRILPAAATCGADGDSLTVRERAVAEEVVRGATNKEAARNLGITERTVKAHLGAAFAKLGVRDRLQLALKLQGRAEARPQPA